jgi:pimeloyl-ACP methyl ester carboxylesterase
MTAVHHHYATVDGQQLFYREAGPSDAPAVVLLHGFPASSFMFRELIPLLADRYHVIAPDHLGFGLSDAPPVSEFSYTFDALAELTAGLLSQLGVRRYAIYVQDYGAPVGWRLALADPVAVGGRSTGGGPGAAPITQNGNGYEAGLVDEFWKPMRAYWRERNPQTEAGMRQAFTLEAIQRHYLHGVPDPSLVSPDTWQHDFAQLSRPGNDLIQLALFADYASNLTLYPKLHAWLRERQIPVLAVWGRNDEIFGPAGAVAFAGDSADTEIHLLNGAHFLLESHLDAVAALIRPFLARTLA